MSWSQEEHSECRFKYQFPERMETFFNKGKSEVILKDEALRIFMSVPDTGNAAV